jgi:hypothetical protein
MEEYPMHHLDPKSIENEISSRVWSVKDFAKRHQLDEVEDGHLLQLFGSYATASELQHNAKLPPWHQ